MMRKTLGISFLAATLAACATTGDQPTSGGDNQGLMDGAPAAGMTVTPSGDIKWQPLDPNNPGGIQISVVSGDLFQGPTMFYMQLPAGMKSGAHTHSNDYYSVVIGGAPAHGVSAEDPGAPLAIGSTWHQPGKELHHDACTGETDCIILLNYPEGGFDYFPGPAPDGTATATMKVTPAAKVEWQPLDPSNPGGIQVSRLNGEIFQGPTSFFMKLPAGAKSGDHTHTNDYYSVVIGGAPAHGASATNPGKALDIGSTWFQAGKALHHDSCTSDQDCVILLSYPNGGFDYFPGPAPSEG